MNRAHYIKLLAQNGNSYTSAFGYCSNEQEILYLSPRYSKILGLNSDHWIGKRIKENLSEENWLKRKPLVEAALAGNLVSFKLPLDTENGKRYLSQTYIPDLDLDGKVCGFIFTADDISEEVNLKTELFNAEKRHQSLIHLIPHMVWEATPTGAMTWFSPKWLENTNTRMDENLGFGWAKLVHPEDLPKYNDILQTALRDKVLVNTEFRLKVANGTYKWHRFTGNMIFSQDNEVVKWIGTFTDIQVEIDRKNKLVDEKKKVLALFEQAPFVFVSTVGENHIVEEINDEAQKYIGDECLKGKPLFETRFAKNKDHIKLLLDDIFRSGNPKRVDELPLEILSSDDTVKLIYADLYFAPIKNDDQIITGILCSAVDVTKKVEQKHILEENEKLFNNYIETMPQIAYILNPQGKALYFNKRWYEYTGLPPSNKCDWDSKEIIHPDDYHQASKIWEKSNQDSSVFEVEYRLKRYDGQFVWHLGRATPVKNDYGTILYWIGTDTNIHEQKMRDKKLKEALFTRDQFLSVASHELKTPLTSLKLQSQMILRNLKVKKLIPLERFYQFAFQSDELVGRLNRLIDDMLDVSRIRTGKLGLNKESQEIGNIVREIVLRMELLFEELGVRAPIVMQTKELWGDWDRFRIEQVVTNLLNNAIRYGLGKSVDIEITDADHKAVVSIRDQGQGISQENQRRIFECFERAISSSESSGLGLGLFISQEIIEAHGGKIWVESKLGEGSTFFFSLPMS